MGYTDEMIALKNDVASEEILAALERVEGC